MPDSKSSGDSFSAGISSFVKALGSGLGRVGTDYLTGGGNMARGEALYAQKQQQTQADLKEQFAQKTTRGELIDLDERRSWSAAGGDDAVIGAMNQSAIHNMKEFGEYGTYVETQHKAGLINDSEYNLYTTMIRSGDPNIKELGKAVINSQAKQQSEFMKYIMGSKLQEQKQAGAEKIEGEKLGTQKSIESSRESAAAGRSRYHEQQANRRAELAATAKAKGGKGPQFAKALPGVKDAYKAITTGKDADGNDLTPKQKRAYADMGNMRMVDEGASQADMMQNGLFSVEDADGNYTAAPGLSGIGDAYVDAKQRPAYDAAVRELMNPASPPEKRQKAFERMLASVPDQYRQTVAEQILRMAQSVKERESADAAPAEGDSDSSVNAEDANGEQVLPPPPGDDDAD